MVEDNALHSWSSLPTHSPHWERRETTEPRYDPTAHPSIDLTLTEIPKSYGYTASFSIGTPPSNSSDIDATEAFTKAFDLLVDTGSGLIVVTSSSCLDPECVQVQNRFNCQASVTCHPYHPPTDMAKSDAGSEMGDRKTQDRIGKQDQGGLKSDGSRWFQIYGDGTIANGTLVLDSVGFSLNASIEPQKSTTPLSPAIATQPKQEKVEVKNQPFLVVDQPGLFLFKSYGPGVDGIAGFSLGVPGIQPTLLHNLRALQDTRPDSSSLFTPTPSRRSFMSLWLREGDNFTRDHGGELLINAVDRSRFRGPIHWNMRGPSAVDWSVPLDGGIALAFPDPYNGTSSVITLMAPSSFMSSSSTLSFSTPSTLSGTDFAVLDSGSAGIYFQRPLYHALFESIPGARQQMNGYWRVPCTGSAELRIQSCGE
ncbi:hypothetical protein BGW38_003107 [Lunasporangiospora selenospora]|uniref:Peptidase A1 domain-containing protein n=1 Tax=Lunasporangiospora selenospora TaxID=979761 RepID=A0A9P6FR43_9FUNG|nr:hypothetical protein BGW38_003107 [Lunasporangiospora selenospora]